MAYCMDTHCEISYLFNCLVESWFRRLTKELHYRNPKSRIKNAKKMIYDRRQRVGTLNESALISANSNFLKTVHETKESNQYKLLFLERLTYFLKATTVIHVWNSSLRLVTCSSASSIYFVHVICWSISQVIHNFSTQKHGQHIPCYSISIIGVKGHFILDFLDLYPRSPTGEYGHNISF